MTFLSSPAKIVSVVNITDTNEGLVASPNYPDTYYPGSPASCEEDASDGNTDADDDDVIAEYRWVIRAPQKGQAVTIVLEQLQVNK